MKIHSSLLIGTSRSLQQTSRAIARSLERLSSGKSILSSKDDPAGLAIANGLEAQARGLRRGIQNINEAQAIFAIADGALQTQTELLQRMRELAVQSAQGTLSQNDRRSLNQEFQSLIEEIGRIGQQTEFNEMKLLDGSINGLSVQVGANKNQSLDLEWSSSRINDLFFKQVGTGEFSGATSSYLAPETYFDSGKALYRDFDNDGIIDRVSFSQSFDRLEFAKGDGQGNFTLTQTSNIGELAVGMATADLNSDGYLDIISNGSFTVNTFVMLGNGTGTFTKSQTIAGSPGGLGIESIVFSNSNPNYLSIADIDNDGDQDFATIDGVSGGVRLFKNNGLASFTTSQFLAESGVSESSNSVTFGDVDGDGFKDLVRTYIGADESVLVDILINDQTGQFNLAQTVDLEISAGFIKSVADALLVKDFKGTGRPDIAISALGRMFYLSNSGTGVFSLTSSASFGLIEGEGTDGYASALDLNATESQTVKGVFDLVSVFDGVNRFVQSTIADSAQPWVPEISSKLGASEAIAVVDDALARLTKNRSDLGAQQSRLGFAVGASELMLENTLIAKSQILDTDYASEAAELIRLQILQQAGVAAFTQANIQMRQVMQLLKL